MTRQIAEALDGAYRERNRVVAALIRVGGYRCWVIDAPDAEGWYIVYAETPQGQVSWHVSADDLWLFSDQSGSPLFSGRRDSDVWDGHDTDEKYRRVASLVWEMPR